MTRFGLILLWFLLPVACGADGNTRPEEGLLPERYIDLVKEGDVALRARSYSHAVEAYEEAGRVRIPESPNYEVLVKLAEAYCKQNDRRRGRALLEDFSCTLDVQVGREPCFGEAEIGYLGERNKNLTDECFERMCSEIYLGYYEDPPDRVMKRVSELRKEVERVGAQCHEE